MTTLDRAQVVRVSLELSRVGTGWMTAKKAPRLGRNGRILGVKLREDATDASGTAGVLYIADDPLTAAPDDLLVFYKSASVALTGSATAASLDTTFSTPVPYEVRDVGDVRIGVEITAGGATSTKLYVVVYAELVG